MTPLIYVKLLYILSRGWTCTMHQCLIQPNYGSYLLTMTFGNWTYLMESLAQWFNLSLLWETFGLDDFTFHYKDADFGEEYFSLFSTTDVKRSETSGHTSASSGLNSWSGSQDTLILSSPGHVTQRSQHWPTEFPIPLFALDTQLVLSSGKLNHNPFRHPWETVWKHLSVCCLPNKRTVVWCCWGTDSKASLS